MQVATEQTVLGDFNGEKFSQFGVTSEFFRRDGKFMVRTEGPDGRLGDFEVRHTFGVYPLQQYLIELPHGHVQALSIAWDCRPKTQGGQRWFHLYPNERIGARDELHWTGRQQNWNYMCADCHSTHLEKNYDAATDTYKTRWSEISVGCEACHGPGSEHVALAQDAARNQRPLPRSGLTVELHDRKGVTWAIDVQSGNAVRSAPRTADKEIAVCAQCHARRLQFSPGYQAGEPFTDHYQPSVLTAGLYHPDGQQRDEVYNWASFLSSRMYAKGVTCGDCHEPHGSKLRAPGNQVCAQCHLASKYDAPSHHFHVPGKLGTACTNCHMRTETYMVVDPRHDHSFRIPRPDLSVQLGVPNACNQCHKDRSPAWAAAEIRRHFPEPKPGFQDFAETFAASDGGEPATIGLAQLIANLEGSPIARASALARLAGWPGDNALLAAEAALTDASPLVRLAALDVYERLPSTERRAALPLLSDPSRAVRMRAAHVLAPLPAEAMNAAEQEAFGKAAADYVAAEQYNSDRPENRTNLGGFYAERSDLAGAEREFRDALRLDGGFVQARINLADLYRAQGREADVESTLREGLTTTPNDPSLHHALGLALVRQHRTAAALGELRRAAELAPDDVRFNYVYGVALHSSGRPADGIAVLQHALQHAPHDRELLNALAAFELEAGHAAAARDYAQRVLKWYPDDPQARQVLNSPPGGGR